MSAMVYSKEKNSFLIDLIKESPDTPTLVVVKFREHGNILLDKLLMEGVSVDYIHGESKDREFLIDAFKSGAIKVLITTEVLKEGVNIPNIRRLVNLAAGKSIVWVKQFVGRLLRSDGVHTDCEVYDFIDVGTHLRDQSLKRLLFYEKEGFDIVNL
jgi:superfamily II DNA or RNA helicase